MNISAQENWNKEFEGSEPSSVSEYAKYVQRSFPRNSKILELGGGDAADGEFFVSMGHSVTLVDISDVVLKKAEQRIKQNLTSEKLSLLHFDYSAGALPFPDCSFDIVYSHFGLQFFDFSTTVAIFKEIKRVLQKNGQGYFAFKSPDDVYEGVSEINFLKANAQQLAENVFEYENQTVSRFTGDQFKIILSEAGFSEFEIKLFVENISKSIATPETEDTILVNHIIVNKL